MLPLILGLIVVVLILFCFCKCARRESNATTAAAAGILKETCEPKPSPKECKRSNATTAAAVGILKETCEPKPSPKECKKSTSCSKVCKKSRCCQTVCGKTRSRSCCATRSTRDYATIHTQTHGSGCGGCGGHWGDESKLRGLSKITQTNVSELDCHRQRECVNIDTQTSCTRLSSRETSCTKVSCRRRRRRSRCRSTSCHGDGGAKGKLCWVTQPGFSQPQLCLCVHKGSRSRRRSSSRGSYC